MKLKNPNGRVVSVTPSMFERYKRKKGWEEVTDSPKTPKHVGAGWYELSNGERVRGKDEALEAENELV